MRAVRFDITSGPRTGESTHFDSHSTWIVGRSKQAQLRLADDPKCSRFHCRFEIQPPACVLVDLQSTNGTRLNGTKIDSQVNLSEGDEVQIGSTTIRVGIEHNDVAHNKIEQQEPEETLDAPTITLTLDSLPQIAGYQTNHVLGAGGMGTVYHARQIATSREVAIKLVQPAMLVENDGLQQFIREASIVTSLKHPHIVESVEFGIQQHTPFLVMEYIEEVDLQAILATSSPQHRMRIAASVVCRLLEALDHAHKSDIVHRDIKPSNLLAFRRGRKLQVKLGDFGLAKNYQNAGFSAISATSEVKGTLAYMSPEQLMDCRYAKPHVDIYAAGACLYEFASGHRPYAFADISSAITMILNDEPIPICERCPVVPERLGDIVHKAMARDTKRRYASASDMHHALLPFTKRDAYGSEG